MTVQELIDALHNLPKESENAKVFFEDPVYSDEFKPVDGLSYSFDGVSATNVYLHANTEEK